MKITSNDSPYQSFPAAVPANLVGMEGYAVELIPGTNTIQLYTATGGVPLLGWLYERLEGDVNWNVRLCGKGGTVRAIAGAGGLAQSPAYVKAAAGGLMVTANSADKAHGVKITPVGADVQGDVIEIIDAFLVVP